MLSDAWQRTDYAGGGDSGDEYPVRSLDLDCLVKLIADAIRDAVADERKACANIVLNGGDGVDRLETAIQRGPNAAIAEAILARGRI